VSGVRRAAAGAAIALGCLASAVPSYAAHDAHHGRPKPWPACPHGHERASYPPRSCHLQTDRSAVQPGGRFDAFGQGFRPGEQVVVTMPADGVQLATVPANRDGAVLTAAVVPASVPAGTHTVTMTAPSGNRVEGVIVVRAKLAAATRAHHDSLPFSGPAAAIPLAAAGVMMLASGAVVMAMVRRRRRFLVDG
jgi:hypothetical protein